MSGGRGGLPLLGVLGGMGPRATADFLVKLIDATPAEVDQDHIPVLTYTLPQVPDRNAALLAGGPSPLVAMQAGVALLAAAGVERIAIACNTAHAWVDELQASTDVPIASMVEAAGEVLRRSGVTGAVALLATEATARTGVYARALGPGLELVLPDDEAQAHVSRAIHEVKAGRVVGTEVEVAAVIRAMAAAGAGAAILGCTELPLLDLVGSPVPLVDSTRALAEACVAWALGG